MHEAHYRDIISGRAKGVGPVLWRLVFGLLSLGFSGLARIRLWLYDKGWAKSQRAAIPVICVGNLSVGGTGKTPMVIALAKALEAQGKKVAVVSRGYRALEDGANDEERLMREELPTAILIATPNRVEGVAAAVKRGAQVAILDDGFSHRRLKRDLDILLFDGSEPFGYRRMLPRGLLREPLASARRAGFGVITRASTLSQTERTALRGELAKYGVSEERLAFAEHRPTKLVGVSEEGLSPPLASLRGQKVVALCGIANPQAFATTLEALGAEVRHLEAVSDHFAFPDAWLGAELPRLASLGADAILVTQKDAVKLRGRIDDSKPMVFELRVEMTLEADGFERLLARVNQAIGEA